MSDLEKFEKCRFGLLTPDGIVCSAGASEHHLELVCKNMCDKCNQYYSHIDDENMPMECDTEGYEYD
jgi:hypothetical protein